MTYFGLTSRSVNGEAAPSAQTRRESGFKTQTTTGEDTGAHLVLPKFSSVRFFDIFEELRTEPIALLPEPNLNRNRTVQNRFYQFGSVLDRFEPPNRKVF